MDLKTFLPVFCVVFLAELGDKTQLATMLFASEQPSKLLLIFVAASAALVLSSAVAVLAGSVISNYVKPEVLSWVAGVGFIAIGIWTIAQA